MEEKEPARFNSDVITEDDDVTLEQSEDSEKVIQIIDKYIEKAKTSANRIHTPPSTLAAIADSIADSIIIRSGATVGPAAAAAAAASGTDAAEEEPAPAVPKAPKAPRISQPPSDADVTGTVTGQRPARTNKKIIKEVDVWAQGSTGVIFSWNSRWCRNVEKW